MFRFSICFHLIVSSFPRSFKAEDAWAVVIATKFKDMGGLTPSKKPSASQMGQKALKCTIELYIQSVSTSARVPICFFSLNNNTDITVCVCYDRSYRISILLATSGYHGCLSQSISSQSKLQRAETCK